MERSIDDLEDALYERFADGIRAQQTRFEELIEEVTGWKNVEDLGRICVETLIRNIGGGGGSPWRTRCACGKHPFSETGEWMPK